jgi:RNA polymerase sigma factor (sigma-70 family)
MNLEELNCWRDFIEDNDLEGLARIYKAYANEMFSYGMKIHPDKNLVMDSMQEVYVRIIEKRETLRATDKIKIYLFKSIRNKILEELRTKHRKDNIEVLIPTRDPDFAKEIENLGFSSEEPRLREKITHYSLNKLSKHQREGLFLKYSLNCSYKEISEILEIDIPSARTLIYRSLKQVKAFILENALLKELH